MNERNEFLTDILIGCKHKYVSEPKPYGYGDFDTEEVCEDCGHKEGEIYNFSHWTYFGKLWKWARTQPWWNGRPHPTGNFWAVTFNDYTEAQDVEDMVDPDLFADAIYKFLKGPHEENT